MTIEFNTPELTELKPKITVLGVGGAGGNAVNNMIQAELQGVDFVVANTDAQALANSLADTRIQLGRKITQGLGAGSQPKIGREAAEEAIEDIQAELDGCHMVFVTAGMGGGTGTGAAPVIAESARDKGILTVGVVTKPFHFEGGRRMTAAEEGIEELQRHVDTLIIIPNQNLFRIATEKTTFQDAFAMADDVLHSGVRGITDLMVMPGLINLDFADVRTVMCEMGKAMMGTGESEGENRAVESAEAAISNPLLDEVSMKGARGVIINITGGMDLTLFEVDEAANYIRNQVDPDANIIVGSAFNESLNGQMRVSVVATGLEAEVTEQVGPPHPSRQSAEVVNFTAARESGGEETDDDEVAAEAAEAVGEQAGTREDAGTASAADVEAGAVVAEDAGDADQTVAQAETGSGTEPESAPESTPEQAPESNPDQPAALRPGDENIFIVPEARKPKQAAVTGQADPFAEAALENAGREAEAAAGAKPSRSRAGRKGADAQSGRGMSLFERMTMGVRGSRSTMDKPANAPAEETADKSETDSEASRLGRVNPDDRPAPKADSQEQLEIPAFLRRQAN